MGLRAQAAADFRSIVEDDAAGFGWPVALTSPSGATATLKGLTTDVGVTIDTDTGLPVVGRRASVVFSRTSLATAGIGTPSQVSEESRRPWVVEFSDASGVAHRYKVIETMPDRALNALACVLESYR